MPDQSSIDFETPPESPTTTEGVRRRQILLARLLAEGNAVRDAMRMAGYSESAILRGTIRYKSRAMSPYKHPVVKEELDKIRAHVLDNVTLPEVEHELKVAATVQDIVQRLERAYQMARKHGQASGMVSAAMGMAKVLGLVVDQKRAPIKPLDQMSEEELKLLLGDDGDKPRH